MHPHALWYSADEKVTLWQLKQSDYVFDGDSTSVSEWCDRHGVQAFVSGESGYHYKLSSIKSSPHIVYCMGDVSLFDQHILAMVWPRAMTWYAEQALHHIFPFLPQYQLVTISGGADWVDMLVHQLSLQNNIPTIMVLWWWLRYYRQPSRQSFLQKIIDAWGLIVSEFKLDMKPTHYSFPQRNRIVAGLADVVCVPEAGEWSGSLITVDFAIDMHKPIYGVPWSIFSPQSAWLHQYIADGKIGLLHDVSSVLSHHFSSKNLQEVSVPTHISLDDLQQNILQLCTSQAMTIQSFLSVLSVDMAWLLEALTMLEMYGLVMQGSPWEYRCTQKIAK